ncbi:hypothetical protein Bdt_1288 [Bdellovibrio bacteriovorus str. Tiberius]|uniref:Uncharacterized protein n=2 Tax=Bdellovibrio bacteriovorus TaxID=959 RepID=K7ZEZ8_BDEBC|nr:hypothetical protein Bdt_1288 [Bdellovibrio bacteriovorus str. Tiberius]
MPNVALAMACINQSQCTDQIKKIQNQLQWNCEVETKSQNCVKLSEEHPDWAPLMRKCDLASQCQEQKEYMQKKSLACLRGYKNAMVDLGISLKDMTVSLAGLVEDSWESIKKNSRERAAFLKQCNSSIDCKKDLVKDDHRYNKLSDEDLNKLPASFLYVQAQDMKAYMSTLERMRPKPYVPIAERARDEVTLTPEQTQKLQSLMSIAGSKIKEQYDRYMCYNALAREELECYAVGTVVDPTLLAGYFVKGARAATAAGRLMKAEKEVQAGAEVAAASAKISRSELTGRYISYSPTSVEQNTAWMARAEKGADSKVTFLDVENSQMKYLNDSLKDKNLVTGLTNYHKELLFDNIKALEAANPGLVIDKYSDFKSSRFAFSGKVPKDIDAQLKAVFDKTNADFNKKLKESDALAAGTKTEDWFRAGIGNSADEANMAARYSRQLDKNEMQSFSQGGLKTTMQQKLTGLEKQRVELRREVGGTSMVDGNTFDQDVFDIVRKGKGDTAQVQQALKNRYALSEVSTGTVQKLQSYVNATDEFSPGIYIAKREIAHLNAADQGGLSVDIIGLGSANLKGTAEALASSSNVNKALESTRAAEKAVTRKFNDQKKQFEDVLTRAVPSGKLKSLCSGDDCVAVAVKPLNQAEKQDILKGLANTDYSGSYRLAFIPDGVQNVSARNALANHGESVEKILRQSLGSEMEPRKLKGLTFGVDMRTQNLNEGSVKLLMGEANGVNLTAHERKRIQEAFKAAIQKFNTTTSTNYNALP